MSLGLYLFGLSGLHVYITLGVKPYYTSSMLWNAGYVTSGNQKTIFRSVSRWRIRATTAHAT